MRACIIADSPDFNVPCVTARAGESDLVIVADGAANKLPSQVVPHIICGDFDSIDPVKARSRFPEAEFIINPCQETNDLEKCIVLAISRGAKEISLSCALGGRMDQTITTLSVIERYHQEVAIVLYQLNQSCRIVSGGPKNETKLTLKVSVGDTISLVPRGDGAVVSLNSVQWPLVSEAITPGSRTISNRSVAEEVTLTVHQGVVSLFHSESTQNE